MLPSEPTKDFPYKILKVVGDGASGIVYKANEPKLRRHVAIKFLKPKHHQNKDLRARFMQEARAAAALNHPGVVTIHTTDVYNGAPYIVMEWVEGKTLAEHVRNHKSLKIEDAIALTAKLLDILAEAHASGIIHRDVKPSNLILRPDGRLKLTDFGIARLLEDNLVKTVIGTILATPKFASPEQLNGGEVDARSDLYSSALVFHYLLSGGVFFEGSTLAETMKKMLTANPVRISKYYGGGSARLKKFFSKALAKFPEDRFQSAREMKAMILKLAKERTTTQGPRNIVRSGHRSPIVGLKKVISVWPHREFNVRNIDSALNKLLVHRLYSNPFRGVAQIGDYCMFIANGQIVTSRNMCTGQFAKVANVPKRGTLKLYRPPASWECIFNNLTALPRMKKSRYEPLDTEIFDLPQLFARFAKSAFDGSVYLKGNDGYGLFMFSHGRNQLALLGGNWSKQPLDDFAAWLDSLLPSVTLFEQDAHAHEVRLPLVPVNNNTLIETKGADKCPQSIISI